jgi:hypothetical protein
LQPLLVLVGVALLCGLAGGIPRLGSTILGAIRGYPSGPFARAGDVDWAAHAVSLVSLTVAVGIGAWAGGWIGRRLPLSWAHGRRLGAAGSAVFATIVLALSDWAENAVWLAQLPTGPGITTVASEAFPAVLVWALVVALVAGGTVRLVHRGRPGWSTVVAVLGSIAALEMTAIVAGRSVALFEHVPLATGPWWFPLTLLDQDSLAVVGDQGGQPGSMGTVVMIVAGTLRPLLVATAFVLTYGVRASRAPAPTAVLVAARFVRAEPAPPLLRNFGLTIIGLGVALWTYALAVLTPQLADVALVDEIQSWELHLWAQEIREASVLIVVLGLVIASASRGPVLLPAMGVVMALLAADSMIDAADVRGPGVVAATMSLAVAVAAVGWWLSGVLGGHRNVATQEMRRRLAWAAILAALCAPALFAHASSPGSLTPAGYPAGVAIAAGLLVLVAGGAAVAVRGGGRKLAGLVGVPVLVLAGLGALSGGSVSWLVYAATLGLPSAAITLAVMTLRRGRGSVTRWSLLGIGAIVLAVPIVFVQLAMASLGGAPLIRAAGYGNPVDGLPYFPGAVIVAVPLAVLAAFHAVPRSKPTTAAEPAGTGEVGLASA